MLGKVMNVMKGNRFVSIKTVMFTRIVSDTSLCSLRSLVQNEYFKLHRRYFTIAAVTCISKALKISPKCHVNLTMYGGLKKRESSFSNRKTIIPIELAFTSHETTNVPPDRAKPPVIIMHGLLGSRTNWNTLSKSMHNKTLRKIIAVDARNHGDSPHSQDFSYSHLAEDVRSLMERLSIQKSSLIGHSMGGRAMMLKALKYPHLVEKLIVVDISPVGISPSMGVMKNYLEAMKNCKIEKNISMSAARKSADEQLKSVVSDSMLRLFLTTNLIEDNGNYRWRVNLDAILQNFFSHMIEFPPAPAKPFEGPTLFIGGEKSDFLRAEDHTYIRKYFSNAMFVYVPDAGHWVHSEKPYEFLDIVCNFLEGPVE